MVLESISRIIKVQLPAYLKRIPLPETIGGFARLTGMLIYGSCVVLFDRLEKMSAVGSLLVPLLLFILVFILHWRKKSSFIAMCSDRRTTISPQLPGSLKTLYQQHQRRVRN